MTGKTIKVVWICQVSNAEIRKHLFLEKPIWRDIKGFLKGRLYRIGGTDYAQWNTNAIDEFRSIMEVELHVIFTHPNMRKKEVIFEENGIHFYAESMSDNSLFHSIMRKIKKGDVPYSSWRRISSLVKSISPDIIHMMGAENPQYSLSIFSLPHNIPVLIQLQTMLNAPDVDITDSGLRFQKQCEYKVIQRADYIGLSVPQFAAPIRSLRNNAVIVDTHLMIAERANYSDCEKQFDFVYFANAIGKAVDLAIEAFAIAYQKHPEITLDIIGGASDAELVSIKCRLEELNCLNAVTIEGKLPTHEDVICQIRKSRYALLPLKIDVVSGTVREAMWNGLPIVTTITSGTPTLNSKRESVLLSSVGDHEGLASNMCKLLDNPQLGLSLRKNASITVEEMYGNNNECAKVWVSAYKACIDNFTSGIPIPKELIYNS